MNQMDFRKISDIFDKAILELKKVRDDIFDREVKRQSNGFLENCPICGCPAQVSKSEFSPTRTDERTIYFIRCTCGIEMENENRDSLIKRWNTRSTQ